MNNQGLVMHPDHDLEQFYTQSHLPGVPRPFHQLPPDERIDWGRRMEKAQFEAWAKLHHYDLARCSHEPYAAYRSDLTNAALAGWRGANGEPSAQAPIYQVWVEETSSYADVTREYYEERLPSNRRKVYAAPVGPAQTHPDERAAFEAWLIADGGNAADLVRDGDGYRASVTNQDWRTWQAARATAPQSDHYQQLLGVAYVVLGCLAANGVDIPARFLDAFSDPDSVENPLELLPCDFSPAKAVRAAVEGAKEGGC